MLLLLLSFVVEIVDYSSLPAHSKNETEFSFNFSIFPALSRRLMLGRRQAGRHEEAKLLSHTGCKACLFVNQSANSVLGKQAFLWRWQGFSECRKDRRKKIWKTFSLFSSSAFAKLHKTDSSQAFFRLEQTLNWSLLQMALLCKINLWILSFRSCEGIPLPWRNVFTLWCMLCPRIPGNDERMQSWPLPPLFSPGEEIRKLLAVDRIVLAVNDGISITPLASRPEKAKYLWLWKHHCW